MQYLNLNATILPMSNQTKHDYLGMNYGTASNRVKKKIMFDLVKKCGMDNCFKCKKPIATVDELTVEHKEAWLHNSVELFWDLDNIAFSHAKCNRPDFYNRTRRTHEVVDGKKRCSGCSDKKGLLPLENFHKNKYNYSGYNCKCKGCRTR